MYPLRLIKNIYFINPIYVFHLYSIILHYSNRFTVLCSVSYLQIDLKVNAEQEYMYIAKILYMYLPCVRFVALIVIVQQSRVVCICCKSTY